MFVALSWAFGMTAPLGSFTIPVSCASKVCARSPESKNVMAAIKKNRMRTKHAEWTSDTADPLMRTRFDATTFAAVMVGGNAPNVKFPPVCYACYVVVSVIYENSCERI